MDPAKNQLCDPWIELENVDQQQVSGDTVFTIANHATVDCLYQDHSSSSVALCTLWCQIQSLQVINCFKLKYKLYFSLNLISRYMYKCSILYVFQGSQCAPLCPEEYLNEIESDLLCDLWLQLNSLKEDQIPSSPLRQNLR